MTWNPGHRLLSPLLDPSVDGDAEAREHLRAELRAMRSRAAQLASQIAADLPEFTAHDVSHLDALWGMADLIAGDSIVLTAPEAFVLGGAILIHDLGLAVAAYPGGRIELREQPEWADALAMTLRAALHHAPSERDLAEATADQLVGADQAVLRKRHAEQAQSLGVISWTTGGGDHLYLIAADDLRIGYGHTIGQIAASHWWSIDELQHRLPPRLGALPGMPGAWTVDPLLLASILRCADAIHLSSDRAPQWSRLARMLGPVSQQHWDFQQRLAQPQRDGERLVFTSTAPFKVDDAEAWWLCYDALGLADRELRATDALLTDSHRDRLAGRGVRGAGDPTRLAEFVRADDWTPIDARVEVSDVSKLIARLGGRELYGYFDDVVPVRELIQNASDAERARQSLEATHDSCVTLSCSSDQHGAWVDVSDTGIGMAPRVLSGALLDFGRSLWDSWELPAVEPGLAASAFEPTGRFGIGFFSIFMWSDRVRVTSRALRASVADTWVLEFSDGVGSRPVLRRATDDEAMTAPGTRVRIWPVRGPLAGEMPDTDRMRKLADVCFWLCPSLSINLDVTDGSDRRRLVAANDWLTVDGAQLVRRCSRGQLDEQKVQALKTALQLITDARGHTTGRIALTSGSGSGALVSGGLRVASGSHFAGVLEASGLDAARSRGYASLERHKVAAWVTDQAPRAVEHAWPYEQPALAELVLALGGEPGPLKMATVEAKMRSLDEAKEWARSQDEVVVVDAGAALSRFGEDAKLGSWSQSASEEVLDVPTRRDRMDDIVLVGDAGDDTESGLERVVRAVREAMTFSDSAPTVLTEIRVVGCVTTPPHPVPGIDTAVHDVEAPCTVVRRAVHEDATSDDKSKADE